MILSVSRRTDVPAFFSEWFFNRLKEGYVLTRNPMNFHQVSRISLSPEATEGIVFWTKDPSPMLPRLDELAGYSYYFHFTLNPYGPDVEPGVPVKESRAVPAFRELAEKIGSGRVVWRYDPVFSVEERGLEYHVENFARLARLLKGYTEKCVFSFLDLYPSITAKLSAAGIRPLGDNEKLAFAENAAKAAAENGMKLESCAEGAGLEKFGIGKSRCIDGELLERISGRPLKYRKDPGQRPECGCAASVDAGAYGTCKAGCLYCYAGKGRPGPHDPASPLLAGAVVPGDKITPRRGL